MISLYREEVQGSYFLGPIVTQAIPGTADSISPFIVIDGQQRLTTLTILLSALRNHLKKTDKDIAQEIDELYLINKFKKNDDIYKVLPTQGDRDVYKSIVQSKQAKDIKKEGQIYEAYKFFEGLFKKPDIEDETEFDLTKFKTILLEKLILVNITTDDGDNPYLIFESLNNKGEDLTQADLVRNYIFMKLAPEDRDDIYNNEWYPLQESFKVCTESKEYTTELTNALWFYLRKDGDAVSEKEVYKNIKKRFDRSQVGTKAELENLIKFIKYYQRIKFFKDEPQPKLKRRFERLIRLDFQTCQIFLLNIYNLYDEGSLSLAEFEEILRYLESYFIRRLLANIPTNTLGTVFNALYSEVKKVNADNIVEGLRQVMRSFEKTKVFPDDEAFRQGIIHATLYTKKPSDRAKLILETIETSLTKETPNYENLNIEHVMPQTLSKEWKTALGANHASIHKKWVHTLGNLTLTGYNPQLSNDSFVEKLNILNSSNVSLNKYFQNITNWNEEAIQTRANYLADLAIKIWPR
ncbi:hypothetical protein NIES4071_53840 [Calothrix sp. NIES-4071]|nr:hypothetical protein NIES4071_53840 [Calothrix sp. NIES-4071]BAZ59692.1 hypothetical protein NIES4105_53790 [Calothrix sp. NIES-4105]